MLVESIWNTMKMSCSVGFLKNEFVATTISEPDMVTAAVRHVFERQDVCNKLRT